MTSRDVYIISTNQELRERIAGTLLRLADAIRDELPTAPDHDLRLSLSHAVAFTAGPWIWSERFLVALATHKAVLACATIEEVLAKTDSAVYAVIESLWTELARAAQAIGWIK